LIWPDLVDNIMATRRRDPLKRPPILSTTAIITLLLVIVFFVAFKADNGDAKQDQLAQCRSKCNEHIHSSAMKNPFPAPASSSQSSSSIDSLLLHRQLQHQSASFRRSVVKNTPLASKSSSAQIRPRRLPNLIKVLTGYDDEPYWSVPRSPDGLGRFHTPAIAFIDKPKFELSQQQRRRHSSSSDESVQLAAAAAAAAVWSQSIWSFGSSRMSRVNSEWDAALRWIAVWDNSTLSGDISIDEWANHVVDDLTTLLEACIEQCQSGEGFLATHGSFDEDDHVGTYGVGSVATSMKEVLWRSIFSWVIGKSFGNLDTAMHIVASSVAIYAVHSLLSSGWPLLTEWIGTSRSTQTEEAPDWLIQHEREIELAKTSQARRRQKKGSPSKKTKKRQKQKASTKGNTANSITAKQNSLSSGSGVEGSAQMNDNMASPAKVDDIVQAPGWDHKRSPLGDNFEYVKLNAKSFGVSNDSVGSGTSDGVPSVISLSSATSVTSSPSIKPISSSPSNVPDNFHGFHPPTVHNDMYSQQFPRKNTFVVPTVEQRNEAANQLRDFQNAQIRRLVLERQQKVAHDSLCPAQNNLAANIAFEDNVVPVQKKKALKPPPGFAELTPVSHDCYQDNLEEEELLLSKLLDDEDEEELEGIDDASLPISTKSSLDPSAAPFFVPNEGGEAEAGKRHRLEPRSSKASNHWSGSNKIKGVYGGNVW
jgi:hypothetical protein